MLSVSFELISPRQFPAKTAQRALNGIRTHDLALTKGTLYQLSYEGLPFCRPLRVILLSVLRPVGSEGFEPPKGVPQLIYSQPPLATWVTTRVKDQRTVASSKVKWLCYPLSLANPQLEPTMGIEPITYHLQGGCSAD